MVVALLIVGVGFARGIVRGDLPSWAPVMIALGVDCVLSADERSKIYRGWVGDGTIQRIAGGSRATWVVFGAVLMSVGIYDALLGAR